MPEIKQWRELSRPIYEKKPLTDVDHRLSSLLNSPIQFGEEEGETLPLPSQNKTDYWNICFFESQIFGADFLSEEGTAVFIKDERPAEKSYLPSKLYLAPSSALTPLKKSLLQDGGERSLNLGIAPYSLGLWEAKLYRSWVDLSSFEVNDNVKVFRLSDMGYDMAGATAVQKLATLLSSLVQLIGDYEGQLTPDEIVGLCSFEVSLSSNLFLNIAQIQALRVLVNRLLDVYGVEKNQSVPPVFCIPSMRWLSSREHWNNLLRLTVMNASSLMGGANGQLNLPFDVYSCSKENQLSRNVDLILQKEAFLKKVSDSSHGSYSVDQLVHRLCEKSWRLFQEIDEKQGLKSVLRSGWLQEEINRESGREIDLFMKRQIKMTGVNDFVLLNSPDSEHSLPKQSEVLDLETWWKDFISTSDAEKLCDVKRLVPFQLSQSFEKWQFKGDSYRLNDPTSCKVGMFVESSMVKSPKVGKVKNLLALGGFSCEITEDTEAPQQLNVIIASDPEGDYAKKILSDVKKASRVICLWAGEKNFDEYDGFIGESSELHELYQKMYVTVGES